MSFFLVALYGYDQCIELCEIANENVSLFQAKIIRFINSQIERIEAKEISEGTVCNYVKAIKLFCNMNDIMNLEKKQIIKFRPKKPCPDTLS